MTGGALTLLGTASLSVKIGGMATPGTDYSLLTISGAGGNLSGSLVITFVNGFGPSVSTADTFSVLTGATALTGSFSNASNGQRLFTSDGIGSFQINYGSGSAFATNSVVLSNFITAIPEPATYALGVGCGVLGLVVWRRRRI